MNYSKRFLIPAYLVNTLRIKCKAKFLHLAHPDNPYQTYQSTVTITPIGNLQPKYHRRYSALNYMNTDTAKNYYRNHPRTIHDVMIGLIINNEILDSESGTYSSQDEILSLADQIMMAATIEKDAIIFYTQDRYDKFDLDGKTYSGILQGKAASLFLRCYDLTKDDKYRKWAYQSLLACRIPFEDGGTLRSLPNGTHWIEEYTSPSPSLVLNGFIFCIIALAEYLANFQDDKIASLLTNSLESLIAWLPYFQVDNSLLYSMYHWDLCNVHYLSVVYYQVRHLNKLIVHQDLQKFENWLKNVCDDALFKRMLD